MEKYLPFKIPNINFFNFNTSMQQKNGNFRLIKYYLNNYEKYVKLNIKNNNNRIKIMTFNVHFLSSINLNDTLDDCYNYLLKLLNKVNADVIGLQEFPISHISKLKENKEWNIIYTNNGSSKYTKNQLLCILITKHQIINSKIYKLFKKSKFRNSIYAKININDKVFNIFVTHLPIGKRYDFLTNYESTEIHI